MKYFNVGMLTIYTINRNWKMGFRATLNYDIITFVFIPEGYGATVLNAMRCKDGIEFPLTLGRDFCGEIVQKGLGLSSRDLDIGDEVWGVVPLQNQGSHAEYVVVDRYCVRMCPVR